MAPDIPSDNIVTEVPMMRDDNNDKASNPTRRVAQLNKGKSIKQYSSNWLEEEPISQQLLKDQACLCDPSCYGFTDTRIKAFFNSLRHFFQMSRETNTPAL